MKILLDLQGIQCGSSVRGIGRYSRALAKGILQQAGSHDISIMLNHTFDETIDAIRQDFSPLIEPEKILVWQSLMPVAENNPDNRWRIQTAELLREQFIQNVSPDIVHISSLIEGICDDAVTSIGKFNSLTPTAATHYDLIPYLNAEKYILNTNTRNWYFNKLESLKQANLLLAISEASRQELITHLKIPEENIITISTDADAIFSKCSISKIEKNRIFDQYNISNKYIMYTGVIDQDDPRKNVLGLIQAFALLPKNIRQAYQLLLVGDVSPENRSTLIKQGIKAGLSKQELIFTNYVNDNELVILYNLCYLFVFPSLHEGFGLPVLEAMRCGAPVIASNCSSIPEVVGLNDALFNPCSTQSIADKMYQVLTDKLFYNSLIQNSKQQSKKFSWDKTAKLTLEAFEALHEKSHNNLTFNISTAKSSLIKQIKQLDGAPTHSDLARTALAIIENQQTTTITKQLLIDVTYTIQSDTQTGIQRVVKNILNELMQSPLINYEIRPVHRQNGQYFYLHSSQFNKEPRLINEPIEVSPQDIFLGLDLDYIEDKQAAHFLNHHRQRGMKLYFVVYDILPLLYPQLFPEGTEPSFSSWFNKITHTADGLISISRAVADEALTYLEKHPIKRSLPLNIGYFHLGANIPENQFNGNEDHDISLIPFSGNNITFLMVGSIEPRKSYIQVLEALERLWQDGYKINLVIIGKEGWHVEALVEKLKHHPQKNQHLFWFKNANDNLLKQLYKRSSALIMASIGEGFGLPLIEAAQYKLPVLCRDIPIFREIAGEHAFYFSATRDEHIAEEILIWLKLFKQKNHPDSQKITHINWEESTRQLLNNIIQQNWYSSSTHDNQKS